MILAKCLRYAIKPIVDRFPRIAAMHRNVRDQLDFMEAPITTPWGFKLAGNTSMAKGTFEPTETDLVRSILRDVDIMINVGANIGYYCCHALSMGKTVIAFEPIERNLRYLYRNIKINGWSGAEVYPIALSNSVGILDMYGCNTGASIIKGWGGIPGSYVSLVPSSTLDVVLGKRLLGKKVFILVDIEGSERLMLEGATMMLCNTPKPVWMVEIMSTEHQPEGMGINPHYGSIFKLFFQYGYQAFCADPSLKPITMEDVNHVLKGKLRSPAYNFLFQGGMHV